MATIYDVAKGAGVSTATVSAVLNRSAYVSPELTKKVKQAVSDLDYTINHLARSMQTRSTSSVGMLIPGVGAPDPFYGQVVRGAEDVFRKRGYALILGHTYNQVEEQSRYLYALRSRLVDGLLLFQAPGEDAELRRVLQEKRPIVFVGRVPRGIHVDVAATDILKGTQMAVEYLIQKGHKRIGLITVRLSLSVALDRIEGWRRSLIKHGLPADESWVVEGNMSSEAGCSATKQLLAMEDPPTAIFADNLIIMTGILEALQECGIDCPKQLEVMSSDDAEWLNVFRPPISTVIQPSYELGAEAAQLLLKRIRHPKRRVQTISLQPKLKIRT